MGGFVACNLTSNAAISLADSMENDCFGHSGWLTGLYGAGGIQAYCMSAWGLWVFACFVVVLNEQQQTLRCYLLYLKW